MPLPDKLVDHLFAKLSVRWGAAFMRQWPDTDPALVKADWAEVLDGCTGHSLNYALRNLPASPCNAVVFRELCRRAPPAEKLALTHEAHLADPARVRDILATVTTRQSTLPSDATQRLVAYLLAIAAERGEMSRRQREVLGAMRARGQISVALTADVERWLPAAPAADDSATASGT